MPMSTASKLMEMSHVGEYKEEASLMAVEMRMVLNVLQIKDESRAHLSFHA